MFVELKSIKKKITKLNGKPCKLLRFNELVITLKLRKSREPEQLLWGHTPVFIYKNLGVAKDCGDVYLLEICGST